jgi:hypothetical protein
LASVFSYTVARDTYSPAAASDGECSSGQVDHQSREECSSGPGSNSASPPPKNKDHHNLTSGAIAGIVVGIVVAVASIFVAVLWLVRRRKSQTVAAEVAPNVTEQLLNRDWHRPELDGTQRHELAVEHRIHEMGSDTTGQLGTGSTRETGTGVGI